MLLFCSQYALRRPAGRGTHRQRPLRRLGRAALSGYIITYQPTWQVTWRSSLIKRIKTLLTDPALIERIDLEWNRLSKEYEALYSSIPKKYMIREELSFHDFIKLLGFLCVELSSLKGDVVEIGVWKGKSLAFMQRLSNDSTKVIGIDPCELEGQRNELNYFQHNLFSQSHIVVGYSQTSIDQVLTISRNFKILHIDGGHARENVWMDFLIYERFVVPGGYIVFDDYRDSQYCPEVGPTIDRMRDLGLFDQYHIVGSVSGYENSYVLSKKLVTRDAAFTERDAAIAARDAANAERDAMLRSSSWRVTAPLRAMSSAFRRH